MYLERDIWFEPPNHVKVLMFKGLVLSHLQVHAQTQNTWIVINRYFLNCNNIIVFLIVNHSSEFKKFCKEIATLSSVYWSYMKVKEHFSSNIKQSFFFHILLPKFYIFMFFHLLPKRGKHPMSHFTAAVTHYQETGHTKVTPAAAALAAGLAVLNRCWTTAYSESLEPFFYAL